MKKQITILILILVASITAWTQAPQAFKYQALARATNGDPMMNELLDIRLTIITDDPQTGTAVYVETHQITTTLRGIFSLNVGNGNSNDSFDAIDWGSHAHFLKVELKKAGQSDYKLMGIAQSLSVPYALHAKTVTDKNDDDADPVNEIQTLAFNPSNNQLSISSGNSITIPSGGTDADPDPQNEIQTLEIETDSVFLDSTFFLPLRLILTNPADTSNQDTVIIPDRNPFNELQDLYSDFNFFFPAHAPLISEVDLKLTSSSAPPESVDANSFNEFQTLDITADGENSILDILTRSGMIWSSVLIKDTDPLNEIQVLGKNGNVINLNKGGGQVVLLDDDPTNELQNWNNLPGIPAGFADGIDDVDDADADPTNELQTLTLLPFPYTPSGEKLRLILKDPQGNEHFVEWENDNDSWNEIQELQKEGNVIKLINGSYTIPLSQVTLLDDDPTNELQDWSTLPGIPVDISDGDDVEDADSDPGNELQNLSLAGTQVTISNGNTIDLAPIIPPGGTDDQQLALNGTTLSIESGNSIDLSLVQDGVEDADADPENEIQNLELSIIESPNGWKSKIDILDPTGNITNSVFIEDTDVINELQRIRPLSTNPPGGEQGFYIVLEEKLFNLDGSQTFQWVGTDTICIPDSDRYNEIQELDWEIHTNNWSNDWELQLLRQEVDSITGLTNWVVGDSLLMPDPDPVNELQRLEINPFNTSDSKLKIVYKICVPDSLGNPQTVWVPFGDSIIIEDTDPTNEIQDLFFDDETNEIIISGGNPVDLSILQDGTEDADADPSNEIQEIFKAGNTIGLSLNGGIIDLNDDDPTNELQTLSFNPNNQQLSLSGANPVDLSTLDSPWDEDLITNTAEYDGTAKATAFETALGACKATDDGFERNDPATGKNISNICMNTSGGNSVGGRIELLNVNEDISSLHQTCAHASGTLNTFGPNGSYNVTITHDTGFPNRGMMGVVDANDFIAAGFYIDDNDNGILFAWNKSFRMEHPGDPSKEIWYASLEGPEGAAYERGTAKLVNGLAFVPFSEHFREVINPETMTVMLTPLSAETYGLAVIEKNPDGFLVKELMNGQGNFEFDWEVKSIRKGLEDFEVIRERRKMAAFHEEHPNGNK